MQARWTVCCDGLMAEGVPCNCIVRGEEEETTHEVARRARERGWTHDLRTGSDYCTGYHVAPEGGDPSP